MLAALSNHTLAALVGSWVAHAIEPVYLRSALALLFLGMAVWALIPDARNADMPNIFMQRSIVFSF